MIHLYRAGDGDGEEHILVLTERNIEYMQDLRRKSGLTFTSRENVETPDFAGWMWGSCFQYMEASELSDVDGAIGEDLYERVIALGGDPLSIPEDGLFSEAVYKALSESALLTDLHTVTFNRFSPTQAQIEWRAKHSLSGGTYLVLVELGA